MSGLEDHPQLVQDIVQRIMDLCYACHEYDLLSRCALVNWSWNHAASRVLYQHVVFAAPFQYSQLLRDNNTSPPDTSNFTSASLPKNAPYVISLEISGYLSTWPPPQNTLGDTLAELLPSFVNLCSVNLTPQTYHPGLFAKSLSVLLNASALTSMTVNASCSDAENAPQLVQISGLRVLTLVSPGRAMLNILPDWLARISDTLTELHLTDNCGSVTPGVLKAIEPHMRDRVVAFSLGLSYSLTDLDVSTFLGALSRLRRVHLRYYWQMRRPPSPPRLALTAFSAAYAPFVSQLERTHFGAWVQRAIAGAAALRVLTLQCESEDVLARVPEGLLEHVTVRHRGIRVLDLGEASVRMRRLRALLEGCAGVEELVLGADKRFLDVFVEMSKGLVRLRSVTICITNRPRAWTDAVLDEKAREMLSSGPPALRRVTIDHLLWEAAWCVAPEGGLQFAVRQVQPQMPPWRRPVVAMSEDDIPDPQ